MARLGLCLQAVIHIPDLRPLSQHDSWMRRPTLTVAGPPLAASAQLYRGCSGRCATNNGRASCGAPSERGYHAEIPQP
eukprot:365313-Chlamydomonas_euryale.AAC.36